MAQRIGQTTGLPSRATLSDYLSTLGLEGEFGDFLWLPVSRAHDNELAAPMARYFVIHDTSGPNFGRRSFPEDIDGGGKVNDLRNFECHDGWGKAHVVISRTGELLLAHDYSIPWRETKFEQAAEFGGALKGLFLHNEMISAAPQRARPRPAQRRAIARSGFYAGAIGTAIYLALQGLRVHDRPDALCRWRDVGGNAVADRVVMSIEESRPCDVHIADPADERGSARIERGPRRLPMNSSFVVNKSATVEFFDAAAAARRALKPPVRTCSRSHADTSFRRRACSACARWHDSGS